MAAFRDRLLEILNDEVAELTRIKATRSQAGDATVPCARSSCRRRRPRIGALQVENSLGSPAR